MSLLYDLARMTTATTGTGTITLGSAVSSFLTFAAAGVQDGDVVSYAIEDGSNREVGTGTYTTSGTTLTRTVTSSTNSDAAITLSGSATVFITALAADFPVTTGTAPLYACRAWVNFNGTGTVTINASGNVSSITDHGTGNYTINFTTAMPDANYSWAGTGRTSQSSGVRVNVNQTSGDTKTTSALEIRTTTGVSSTALYDLQDVCVAVFR